MTIGCVREIKRHEYRVGMTPGDAREFAAHGHRVFIERGAGLGSGHTDADYRAVGAELMDAAGVWRSADMIVKVKEPLAEEYPRLRTGQILFTYLHLAASEELTRALLDSGASGVAYETVSEDGALPLLSPMSAIAGRLSVQQGAKYLEKPMGGKGVLLSGVPGVRRASVVILGAGVVGVNALEVAIGMGASVTVLDIDVRKLQAVDARFGNRVATLNSTSANIERLLPDADLVIGAVLIPGAHAPKLIRREHLRRMGEGSVLVDVAVDQGGCAETTRATTHDDPTYVVDGVVHYCVANMPGAVPVTATAALTAATLRYGLMIADMGLEGAVRASAALRLGLNTYRGKCTCLPVAQLFGLEFADISA